MLHVFGHPDMMCWNMLGVVSSNLSLFLSTFSSSEPGPFRPALKITTSRWTWFSEHAQGIYVVFSANQIRQIGHVSKNSPTFSVWATRRSWFLVTTKKVAASEDEVNNSITKSQKHIKIMMKLDKRVTKLHDLYTTPHTCKKGCSWCFFTQQNEVLLPYNWAIHVHVRTWFQ